MLFGQIEFFIWGPLNEAAEDQQLQVLCFISQLVFVSLLTEPFSLMNRLSLRGSWTRLFLFTTLTCNTESQSQICQQPARIVLTLSDRGYGLLCFTFL